MTDRAIDTLATIAAERIEDRMHAVIGDVIDNLTQCKDWPGDVDPMATIRYSEALAGVAKQLIGNALGTMLSEDERTITVPALRHAFRLGADGALTCAALCPDGSADPAAFTPTADVDIGATDTWLDAIRDHLAEYAAMVPEPPAKGSRWRLTRDVMRFPHFTAAAGSVGTVTSAPDDYNICLKLDAHLPGAEEWDNEVCWAPEDAMEQDCAAFAFLADCERI